MYLRTTNAIQDFIGAKILEEEFFYLHNGRQPFEHKVEASRIPDCSHVIRAHCDACPPEVSFVVVRATSVVEAGMQFLVNVGAN
jgi:hypothetical protein